MFATLNSLSEHNLVAPYKFMGDDALSVDKAITFFTFVFSAASITFCAPKIFVFIVSNGLYSAVGTCFKAAACITRSISLKALVNLFSSLISFLS